MSSNTTEIIMPRVLNIGEAELVRWMKRVGEHVERDEPLFKISTEEVDVEVPSPATGRLTTILVQEGETARVDDRLAIIERD